MAPAAVQRDHMRHAAMGNTALPISTPLRPGQHTASGAALQLKPCSTHGDPRQTCGCHRLLSPQWKGPQWCCAGIRLILNLMEFR